MDLELIDRILTCRDNKEIPIHIYTLGHSLLIVKVEFYGIKGATLDL